MNNYPTLRLGVLQGLAGLKASFDADESILKSADCPYDEDTIKLLEELFQPRVVEIIKEVDRKAPEAQKRGRKAKTADLSDDDATEVADEALLLLEELRALNKGTDGELKKLDTTTQLQIIKARTQLIEKLVSIRERFANVRKVSLFQSAVISILDDLVSDEGRDEFMKRLEPYRS